LLLLLMLVLKHLLDQTATSPANGWIALLAVAWYGLHPANADTVNYIIASSEIISTMGVIASFAVYFAFPQLRRYYLYVVPAAIAILAKPPAAIFAALFAIYRLLFPNGSRCSHGPVGRNRPSGIGPLRKSVAISSWLLDVIPPFVICAAMLLFV